LYIAMVVVTFIIPAQVLMIPTYMQYARLKILGSPVAFFLPALLGQGLNSSIFILIFYSFFNTIPKSLDESAQIDGASPARVFASILLPLSLPALLISFIFSLVWYWNETYLTLLYIGTSAKTILNQIALVLSTLENDAVRDPTELMMNVPIRMAATFLTFAPLLALYGVLQKQFVEGIDKSGITGE